MERKIRSFEGKEYEKLLDAIEKCEGWFSGDEKFVPIKKIVGVKFLNHKATEFLVQSSDGTKEWLTINKAIVLAEEKSLMVVVVHSHNITYLRAFPHQKKLHDMLI